MQKDNYGEDIMNIGELIKELEKFPDDYLVYTEGCDCIGNAVSVTKEKPFERGLPHVMINRQY